ncbi:MAG: hypothetical protein KDA58_02620 [Planctomycetaceae bacterium]|nr:hypothetical protein [Planctomycetaceae bacterium]
MNQPESPANSPEIGLSIGVRPGQTQEVITARTAGGLTDLDLSISPRSQPVDQALSHLAKALNLALQTDFIETDLDHVYKVAHVREGTVVIVHKDYIGLGDGYMATVGKAARSFKLTLEGPDPASPEGEAWIREHGHSMLRGMIDLVGRKLDFLREYEDMAPLYVQQTLDRLEAKRIIKDWHRHEWQIETTTIGLDIILTPLTGLTAADTQA